MALECIQKLRAKSAMRQTLHSDLDDFNSMNGEFYVSPTHELEEMGKRNMREFGTKRKRVDEKTKEKKVMAFKIEIARMTLATIFALFDCVSDAGTQLTVAQLTVCREVIGSLLPALCLGVDIYTLLQHEIYENYGIRYTGKGHSASGGRRTGKTYGCACVMSIVACAAPAFKVMFVNLYSHAGMENLRTMNYFVDIFTKDKKFNISVSKKDKYNLFVHSHMYNFIKNKIDEDPATYGEFRSLLKESVLTSLPNMDGSSGNVRSFPVHFDTNTRSFRFLQKQEMSGCTPPSIRRALSGTPVLRPNRIARPLNFKSFCKKRGCLRFCL